MCPTQPSNDDLYSPGSSISLRELYEHEVDRIAYAAGAALAAYALAQSLAGNPVTAAALWDLWAEKITLGVDRLELDADTRAFLINELMSDTFPDEVFSTARDTSAEAASMNLSDERRRDVLTETLSMDTGTVVLAVVAGVLLLGGSPTGTVAPPKPGAPDKVFTPTPEAPLPGLRVGAMSWKLRMRYSARTVSTRLNGWLTQQGLSLLGIAQKRWVSRHDPRVRSTHAAADGQTVAVNQPFLVGGELLRYPGDGYGSAGETINCRCVMVGVR